MAKSKRELSIRRHWRVRKKIMGTAERPRLSVKFSGRHIHIQFIDDTFMAVLNENLNAAQRAGRPELVTRLSAIADAIKEPDVRERFNRLALDPFFVGPREFNARVLRDAARWKKVADDAGIKPAE